MKLVIIGGGWYGLHIAYKYQNIYDIIVLEKNNDIFTGSSYFNQNRLHQGYHYPRSYKTRKLCKDKNIMFMNDYSHIVDDIQNNYYLISNESFIDYETYINIFRYDEYDFTEKKNDYFTNIQKNIISCNEKIINHQKAKDFFKENIKNCKIKCNFEVKKIEKIKGNKMLINDEIECDFVINCTYGQSTFYDDEKGDIIYEKTISHIYKKIKDVSFDCITIMDGNFPSLFIRNKEENLYSLTHVKYTPLLKSNSLKNILTFVPTEDDVNNNKLNMENDMKKYLSSFDLCFEYVGYYFGYKLKKNDNSDDRTCNIYHNENYISVNGGKITGIYDFEIFLNNYLDNGITHIYNLFCTYIKRYPTKEELQYHSNNYIKKYKKNKDLIEKEFDNCKERKININLESIPNNFAYDNKQNNISNMSNLNNDVLIRYHEYKINDFNSFSPVIAVDNDKNMISDSNSYLLNEEIKKYKNSSYETQYEIYKNININYNNILNCDKKTNINDRCLYLCNAFNHNNIGHALSIIFNVLNRYKNLYKKNYEKIVISENSLNNVKKILYLFFEKHEIIEMESEKTYLFKNIIIPKIRYEYLMSIERSTEIISEIINSNEIQKYKDSGLENKKIIMIKQENISRSSCRSYNITSEIKKYCEENNIDIIKPEDYDIYKLIYMLNNASMIMTSAGAISYAHMIFFNKKAKLYFVGNRYFYSNKLDFEYICDFTYEILTKIKN